MNSRDLTKAQANAVHEQLRPMVGHLHKLQDRMDQRGFPIDDELYLLVKKAREAMDELFIATHYLGCDNVGRPK